MRRELGVNVTANLKKRNSTSILGNYVHNIGAHVLIAVVLLTRISSLGPHLSPSILLDWMILFPNVVVTPSLGWFHFFVSQCGWFWSEMVLMIVSALHWLNRNSLTTWTKDDQPLTEITSHLLWSWFSLVSRWQTQSWTSKFWRASPSENYTAHLWWHWGWCAASALPKENQLLGFQLMSMLHDIPMILAWYSHDTSTLFLLDAEQNQPISCWSSVVVKQRLISIIVIMPTKQSYRWFYIQWYSINSSHT